MMITKKHKVLLLLVFLMFLFSYEVYPKGNVFDIYAIVVSALLLFALIFVSIYHRKLSFKHNSKVLFLFIVVQVLTFVFAVFNEQILPGFILVVHQMLILIILLLLIKLYNFSKHEVVVLFANLLIVNGVLSLFYAYIGYALGDFSLGFIDYVTPSSHERLTGWYGSPNRLAPAIALSIYASLYRLDNDDIFFNTNTVRKWLKVIVFFAVVGIFLTGSRGTYVSFIAGFLLYLAYSKKVEGFKSIKNKLIMPALLVSVLVFLMVLLEFVSISKIVDDIVRVENIERQLGGEGAGRMYYWMVSVDKVKNASTKELLFGYGPRYLSEYLGKSPHSGFFTLLVDRGVVISAIYVYLLGYMIYLLVKRSDKYNLKPFLVPALIFMFIKNFTNYDFPNRRFVGIIMIFTIVLISFVYNTSKNKHKYM